MKKKLTRRAVLRGAGGTVLALPFLEAMLGSGRTVAQSAEVPKRVVFMFSSCGISPATFWPTGGETDFVLGRSLEPLAAMRDKLIVLDGLSYETAKADRVGQNGHDKGTAHCLTATAVVEGPEGVGRFGHLWDGSAGGVSIDQHMGSFFEGVTPYRSLEFGVKAEGIGQALPSRISYRAPFEPVIPMNDAGMAFDRIFAPLVGSSDEVQRRHARRSLVLDYVDEDLARLHGQLGAADRRRLDAHIGSIADVRDQLATLAGSVCEAPARETSNDYEPLGRIQMDLLVQALKCDLTRVATVQWSNGQSGVRLPGFQDGHHAVSHKGPDERPAWDTSRTYAELAIEYDRFYARQMMYLLEALDAVDEGDGQTLLDHTAVVWINEQQRGIGNNHGWDRMPFVIGGGLGGSFRTGRYVTADGGHANLFVSLMQGLGMPDTTFGQPEHCTGEVAGLT